MARKHARFSPSKLEALERCLRFEYEETDNNAAADEGTLLHAACESGNLAGLSEEQVGQVWKARGFVDSMIAGLGAGTTVQREAEVELTDLTYGTADVVAFSADRTKALVCDFKFGRRGVEDAESNFQVQTYAAAVLEHAPEVETITGYVIEPRLDLQPVPSTWGRDLLPQVRARIEALYERLHDPFLPPTAHSDLCSRCRWRAKCPQVTMAVTRMAPAFDLTVPEGFTTDPACMTPEHRAFAQAVAPLLEKLAEAWKKANTEFVANGGEVPFYKLISKSTGLRIPRENTSQAAERILKAGYATAEQVISSAALSIPELAKLMATVKGSTETEERQAILALVSDLARDGRTQYLQKMAKLTETAIIAAVAGRKEVTEQPAGLLPAV